MCLGDRKEAVVIMTNSSNGESIFKELVEKLTGVTIPWEWEGYTPYRGTVRLPASLLAQYAGNYTGKFNVSITVKDGLLVAVSQDAQLPPTKLYATNDHHFFLKTMDVELDFVRGPDGKVAKIAVADEGEKYDLVRAK